MTLNTVQILYKFHKLIFTILCFFATTIATIGDSTNSSRVFKLLNSATSKMKSTISFLGLKSSCWNLTLRTSPSRASRTALQTHSLWQTKSRPDSLRVVEVDLRHEFSLH